MGGEISGDRNEDLPALVGVAPDCELPGSRFQYLVSMKARVLPQHRMRERVDQRLRRMAKLEMPRHEPCRTINLSLAVERVEQSDPDRHLIGRKIVELLPTLAWDTGRRHIEVAIEIESHRTVQHSPRRRQVIDGGDPDPPEHLAERVGVGEDVVRRLPVGVLVGVAEACHPERRPVSEQSAKISGSGAASDGRLDRFSDPNRIVAKQLPSKRRMIRPANRATAFREHRRQSASLFVTKGDKIDRLSPFSRFLAPRAAAIWPTTVGSREEACPQPIRSRGIVTSSK